MKNENFDTNTLIKFLFHQANQEEEGKVLEWMEEDRSRYQTFEKFTRAKAIATQSKGSDWAKKDFVRLQNRIKYKHTRRLFMQVAAVFIGLIIISYSAFLIVHKSEPQWQSIATAKGQQNEIILQDGTKVWLAPDTKLRYPVTFSSHSREVKLEGQAYFDVAHEKNHPFIVHANHADIEVLGTKFNVKAYQNESITTTVLVEGKVNIGFYNEKGKRIGDQLLSPSQKCNFNSATLKYNVHKVDLKHELAWREKRLSFRNETFREIANKIERHYNIKVIFKDNNLTSKKFTGEFQDEPIEEVLETFKEWASFEYEINNNKIYIKKLPM